MRLAASVEYEGSVKGEKGKRNATIVERPAAPATSHHGYYYYYYEIVAVTDTVTGCRRPPSV